MTLVMERSWVLTEFNIHSDSQTLGIQNWKSIPSLRAFHLLMNITKIQCSKSQKFVVEAKRHVFPHLDIGGGGPPK